MKFRLHETPTAAPEVFASAYTNYSAWIDVGGMGGDSISCTAVLDVDTPANVIVASADIDFATNNWESVAHGLSEGLKVRLTTSDTLPDPLLVATDYFVIVVDEDNFQLAATLADAQAGTPITLVDSGVGDQTVIPTALAGGSIVFQQANNKDYPVDIGSPTNVTADGSVQVSADRPTYRFVRAKIALTAGHISADLYWLVKGDRE